MSWYRFRVVYASGNTAELYLYGRGDDVIPDALRTVAVRLDGALC